MPILKWLHHQAVLELSEHPASAWTQRPSCLSLLVLCHQVQSQDFQASGKTKVLTAVARESSRHVLSSPFCRSSLCSTTVWMAAGLSAFISISWLADSKACSSVYCWDKEDTLNAPHHRVHSSDSGYPCRHHWHRQQHRLYIVKGMALLSPCGAAAASPPGRGPLYPVHTICLVWPRREDICC